MIAFPGHGCALKAVLIVFFLCGCASQKAGSPGVSSTALRNPHSTGGAEVQEGDRVRVDYSVFLEDGSLVRTTVERVAKDTGHGKVPWYEEPKTYSPEEIVAGKKAEIPGLADAVLSMTPKQRKTVTLPPEKAYGLLDLKKTVQLPCVKTLPRIIRISNEKFVKTFGSAPAAGREVDIVQHLSARVIGVTEKEAVLQVQAVDGERADSAFGSTLIRVGKEEITLTLSPKVGAVFSQKGRQGRITSTDGAHFTVDFNSPLAGKSVVVDMEVLSLTKAPAVKPPDILWVGNHGQGLEAARLENKPMVLVLYAEWCGWCKKLFSDTFPDPRVTALKDRFVWVRIDSNQEPKFREMYGQQAYPMIVFLSEDGKVVGKIRSFVDGGAFRKRLDDLLKVLDQP